MEPSTWSEDAIAGAAGVTFRYRASRMPDATSHHWQKRHFADATHDLPGA